jgi:solute carrier family 35 protein E1
MPHATRHSATQVPFKFAGDTKMTARPSMEKFPDMDLSDPQALHHANNPSQLPSEYFRPPPGGRWQPPADSLSWMRPVSTGGRGHSRQKSLGDAFRTIRTRKGSVNANIHEISDALKAPVSPRLVVSVPPPRCYSMLTSSRRSAWSGTSRAP